MSPSFTFGVRPDISYGSPGAGSAASGRPFDPVYKTEKHGKQTFRRLVSLKNCCFMWGRTMCGVDSSSELEVPNSATGPDSGIKIIYVSIKHPDGDKIRPEPSIVDSSKGSDNENTVFPLYQLYNGKIRVDYRGMPWIPVYT